MSNYVGPKNRLSRREGLDLFSKGNKLRRASQPPGMHGAKGAPRPTEYGTQLREKQKTKRLYGIIEGQFRKYFEIARRVRGKTGETLLVLLEMRLDNVVYRLGLAQTRSMARQLVSHRHVLINGKVVNIPSCQVKVGDVITLDDTAANIPHVKIRLEDSQIHSPAWLERLSGCGKIARLPQRSDIDVPVNEQLIVEFYSR
jgi:small subunit ribosomal protein S4